ncbi:MAG TPA: hypothetical protein VFX02_13750 [Gammaproteobacteria bacterium]|nr:hypothetical protein [Gammaproteobacteria bacterium]
MLTAHFRKLPLFRHIRLILAALVCAFSMLPATGNANGGAPSVLVIAGGSGLTSMFYDCVRHYQQQGLKIPQAIGQCMAIGVVRQSVAGRNGLGAEFVGGGGESGAVGIQCATLSVDPRVAQIVRRSPDPGDSSRDPGLPLLGRPGTFDNNYSAFAYLLGLLSSVAAQDAVALREQAKNTTDSVQKQILLDKADAAEELAQAMFDAHDEIMAWYLARLAEYEESKKTPPSPPGDYPLPNPDAPQVADVTSDHVSACENLTQFVNDCRLAGWKTAPCQMFLDRLDGCGDPTITDPSPDEERECGSRRVSDEQARHVAFIACSVDTTPGPDSDPCSGNIAQAMAYDFTYGKSNPNAPICSNPFAYTTAESCTATFTVLVGTQQGAESVIEEAQRRLGGPVFVIPAPSPLDPKSGGGCAGDPRCSP